MALNALISCTQYRL